MTIALQPVPTHPTSTTEVPPSSSPELSRLVNRLYGLTVDQYHAMAEAGILGTQDRIELIEGLLVNKRTKSDSHILATELTQGILTRALPDGWYVSMQNPITIAEPDAKIVRGAP